MIKHNVSGNQVILDHMEQLNKIYDSTILKRDLAVTNIVNQFISTLGNYCKDQNIEKELFRMSLSDPETTTPAPENVAKTGLNSMQWSMEQNNRKATPPHALPPMDTSSVSKAVHKQTPGGSIVESPYIRDKHNVTPELPPLHDGKQPHYRSTPINGLLIS